ncbi:MAG: hypothetical protein U1E00_00490, partial [Pseudoxanthomonas sp.]|nr:hypothetical protein [Pseudoxanthomonas sp.]
MRLRERFADHDLVAAKGIRQPALAQEQPVEFTLGRVGQGHHQAGDRLGIARHFQVHRSHHPAFGIAHSRQSAHVFEQGPWRSLNL